MQILGWFKITSFFHNYRAVIVYLGTLLVKLDIVHGPHKAEISTLKLS